MGVKNQLSPMHQRSLQQVPKVVNNACLEYLAKLVHVNTVGGRNEDAVFDLLDRVYKMLPQNPKPSVDDGVFTCQIGDGTPNVAFIFHTDTVGATRVEPDNPERNPAWNTNPFALHYANGDKGIFYGRGVADDKIGAVVPLMLGELTSISKFPVGILAVGVNDEETGRTSQVALNDALKRHMVDYAIVIEPTSNKIITRSNAVDIYEISDSTPLETILRIDSELAPKLKDENHPIFYDFEIFQNPSQYLLKLRYNGNTESKLSDATGLVREILHKYQIAHQKGGWGENTCEDPKLIEAFKQAKFGVNGRYVNKSSLASIITCAPWLILGPKHNMMIHRNNEGLYRDSVIGFVSQLYQSLIYMSKA